MTKTPRGKKGHLPQLDHDGDGYAGGSKPKEKKEEEHGEENQDDGNGGHGGATPGLGDPDQPGTAEGQATTADGAADVPQSENPAGGDPAAQPDLPVTNDAASSSSEPQGAGAAPDFPPVADLENSLADLATGDATQPPEDGLDGNELPPAGGAVSDADETAPATPREIAICAAVGATLTLIELMRNPVDFALFRASENKNIHELADILDNSPQLPAEAMMPFLAETTIGENVTAAEAFKATYLGLKPWVEAEVKRVADAAAEAERLAREPKPSRYEKTGVVEPVGAKIVDEGERARIRAARDATETAKRRIEDAAALHRERQH